MAFAFAKSFELPTAKGRAIVLEVHRYTKLAADAGGTVTRFKGRKIRRIVKKSDAGATAVIAANRKDVTLTGLNTTAGNADSLSGFVAIEVERI